MQLDQNNALATISPATQIQCPKYILNFTTMCCQKIQQIVSGI